MAQEMRNMFRRNRWFYYPVTLWGWLIALAVLALIVQTFVAVDSRSHSVSDTFYGVLPYFVS